MNDLTGKIQEADVNKRIEMIINHGDTVLFMKGNSQNPMCRFSAWTSQILNKKDVEYFTYNILMDPELREAIKHYSNWPTFPQLYHKGQLVGGNDIITEMNETGELEKLLRS